MIDVCGIDVRGADAELTWVAVGISVVTLELVGAGYGADGSVLRGVTIGIGTDVRDAEDCIGCWCVGVAAAALGTSKAWACVGFVGVCTAAFEIGCAVLRAILLVTSTTEVAGTDCAPWNWVSRVGRTVGTVGGRAWAAVRLPLATYLPPLMDMGRLRAPRGTKSIPLVVLATEDGVVGCVSRAADAVATSPSVFTANFRGRPRFFAPGACSTTGAGGGGEGDGVGGGVMSVLRGRPTRRFCGGSSLSSLICTGRLVSAASTLRGRPRFFGMGRSSIWVAAATVSSSASGLRSRPTRR